ncbi:MAG: hypothetical protein ACP5QG_02485 [candidate division WOR-3 bacterium]
MSRKIDDDRIEEILRGLPRLQPPPGLKREIYARARASSSRKKWLWALSPIPAAALAGVLVAVLLNTWHRKSIPTPIPHEPVVVAPADGEVLLPDEVEFMTYGGEGRVELDGIPVAAKQQKEPGAFIYIPQDLEPGYHRVVIEIDGKKVEASFFVEEPE